MPPDDTPNVNDAEELRQQGEDQQSEADRVEEEARARAEEEKARVEDNADDDKAAIDEKYGTL
jgi:hypothetical protein